MKDFLKAVGSGIKKVAVAVGRFFVRLFKEQKGFFAAVIAGLVFVVLCLLKCNSSICEFWTRTIGRALVVAMGTVNSLLPISVYEWSVVAVICYFVTLLVVLIVKLVKKKGKAMLPVIAWTLAGVLIFLDFYTAAASFAYNREEMSLDSYSVSESGALSLEEYTSFCKTLTEEMNRLATSVQREDGQVINPYTRDELNAIIAEEMKSLSKFDGYFTDWTGRYKQPVFSRVLAEMGILGVFVAPFGEANVSTYTHPLGIPTTIAHELAHSKGVMRENQANLVAYYVTLRSDNDYLRYSAMQSVYYSCLNGLHLYDGGDEVYDEIVNGGLLCELAKTDYRGMFKYYSQFTLLEDISDFFNDLYLKLQGQSEGSGSYNDTPPQFTIVPGEGPDEETKVIHDYSDIQSLVLTWYKENY